MRFIPILLKALGLSCVFGLDLTAASPKKNGHMTSAEMSIRAWALIHNFLPYCPYAKIENEYVSPAHKLNGFVYHENRLQNLLVSASMGGCFTSNTIR